MGKDSRETIDTEDLLTEFITWFGKEYDLTIVCPRGFAEEFLATKEEA